MPLGWLLGTLSGISFGVGRTLPATKREKLPLRFSAMLSAQLMSASVRAVSPWYEVVVRLCDRVPW